MANSVIFRKFNGERVNAVVDYIKSYVQSHKETEVLIGTDSQNRGDFTIYGTVIGLYEPGHGAHCIFKKWKERRERTRSVRLMNEVWASLEVAEELRKSGVKEIKYIDIDINQNPKFKSNEVYASAKGMAEGMGYKARFKPDALVTILADYVVKH